MMKEEQILNEIKGLAASQGFYGRLYEDLVLMSKEHPAAYDETMRLLEREGFETTLDLVLYFEEGKHCKRKVWKLPVTWEMSGTIEVEGETAEEAIENFKKVDESAYNFDAPFNGSYVEGSISLLESIELIKSINKDIIKEED